MTGIQWTDEVWNPTTGCDRVSDGCDHCYALTMAKRLKGMGQAKYQRDGDPRTSGPGFGLTTHADALQIPLRWRHPRKVFVNSMSDLFHDDVPDEFIAEVFATMALAPQHTFQLLTKRHGRMRSLLSRPGFPALVASREVIFWNGQNYDSRWLDAEDVIRAMWPLPNVWLGVSAEDQRWADIRIPALVATPAAVRFVSAEPLLGPLNLTPWLPHLSWVIAGGESGPGARPMDEDWARGITWHCRAMGVPVFVKQMGAVLGRKLGAGSHGDDWAAWPADLRIREFPRAIEPVTA